MLDRLKEPFYTAFVSVTATVDHGEAMCDALIQTLIVVTFLAIWLVQQSVLNISIGKAILSETFLKLMDVMTVVSDYVTLIFF